jgi:hypothetical protein
MEHHTTDRKDREMRYYGIMHSLTDERPYIEAESTDPLVLEDKYDVTAHNELLQDPELRKALEAWEGKDDSLAAIEHASYVLSTYGPDIVQGANETREAVDLAHGVDDPWCEALRKARPHLRAAAAALEEAVEEVREKFKARGAAARAEREEQEPAESV